jgi:hypothetical protein
MMRVFKSLRWIAPVLIPPVWMGCNGQSDVQSSAPPSEEALVILAKADAVDGTEDKVISKCLTCSLGMDGKAEYDCTFGAYEVHLCSAGCRKHFEANPEKAVLAVNIPASTE